MMHKPWLAHYDPGVPHEITVPPIALPELLATAAHQFPNAPAILFYGRTMTYAELDMLASRFAAALVIGLTHSNDLRHSGALQIR
jgi:long-chain acyl-CoA synthetase